MISFRKTGWIFLVALVFHAAAFAEVTIETGVSRSQVPVGESLTLDIIIYDSQAKITAPTLSSLDGFTSSSRAHSQEISIIGGRRSSRTIFSYVLLANSVGTKSLGPFEVLIDEKKYKVGPVQVEVVAAQSRLSPPSVSSGLPAPLPPRALPSGNIRNQEIFVRAWLDKDEAYVNEAVMLTYTLYTRLTATAKGFEREPVTTGFWVEDFPPELTIKKTEQMVNGVRYLVADLRKLALFPTQPGIYTMDPGTLSVDIQQQDPRRVSYNVFGYANPPLATQMVAQTLSPDPVKLTVKALPETGKPADFNGAVGNFQIESSVDKTVVQQGDPVTYRVRLTGRGNIHTVETPPAPKLEDFKYYDSSSSTRTLKDRLIVEGEKITDTVMVPRKAAAFTIPATHFSYFDPAAQTYKKLTTASHALTVNPGPEGEDMGEALVQPVAKEKVDVIAKDIRYLKMTDDGKIMPKKLLYRHPLYWAFNLAALGLWLFLTVLSRRRVDLTGDLKNTRLRRSHALARKKLKEASRMLDEEKSEEFYAEVSKAIYRYFADKLNLPIQSVSALAIEERTDPALPAALATEIRTLFDELGMVRFGRIEKNAAEMKRVYDRADQVITSFEKVKIK